VAPFNNPTEPMMKGLDVGSLSGRPRPGIALEPELAGVIWAKPYEAARIARSHVIAYTTRFPDGVFLRTETPRRRSGSGLLPFSSPEPDRDRWATRQLSAGPPGCIQRPSRLAGTSEPVREGGNLSHGVGTVYRRNWGGGRGSPGRPMLFFHSAQRGAVRGSVRRSLARFPDRVLSDAAGSWNAWARLLRGAVAPLPAIHGSLAHVPSLAGSTRMITSWPRYGHQGAQQSPSAVPWA
jgi:hypothetical protein